MESRKFCEPVTPTTPEGNFSGLGEDEIPLRPSHTKRNRAGRNCPPCDSLVYENQLTPSVCMTAFTSGMVQWDSSLSVLPVARVMIAQQDNSLSVLSVARIMIAQWGSSLSVLPVARIMIAQWDSSLSVLPCGPDHDSSVG